jgi:hypothetical protein
MRVAEHHDKPERRTSERQGFTKAEIARRYPETPREREPARGGLPAYAPAMAGESSGTCRLRTADSARNNTPRVRPQPCRCEPPGNIRHHRARTPHQRGNIHCSGSRCDRSDNRRPPGRRPRPLGSRHASRRRAARADSTRRHLARRSSRPCRRSRPCRHSYP